MSTWHAPEVLNAAPGALSKGVGIMGLRLSRLLGSHRFSWRLPWRNRSQYRRTSLRYGRLLFEPLEDRRLLADLGLDVRVLVDINPIDGQPDTVRDTEVNPLHVGDTFWVQVRAWDERDPAEGEEHGVISLPLDLTWPDPDEDIMEFTGTSPAEFPEEIPESNVVLTENFPQQRFVTAFQPGSIEDLRGGAIPAAGSGSAIGDNGPPDESSDVDYAQFSLLQFEAVGAGRVDSFLVELAGSMSFADADTLDNDPVAEVLIVVAEETSSLSGFVYADTDNDGVRKVDGNGAPIELGLPNVTISLYRDDELLDQMTTGPSGRYHFEDLAAGTYEIREDQPACFIDGRDTLGEVWTGNEWEARGDVDQDGDRFFNIALEVGEDGVDYNFGELGLRAECINKRLFLASVPSAKEPVAERLGVTTETVRGTNGDDTIEFEADLELDEPVMRVTVNDEAPQEFLISETRMVFVDAGGGSDTATLTLTDADEKVYMLPGYATLRHEVSDGILRDWDYGAEVVNAEEIEVEDLAAGANLVVMRDTPGSDALTAGGDTASLSAEDLERIARAISLGATDRVMAISASGGADTAERTAIVDFALELAGDWTEL